MDQTAAQFSDKLKFLLVCTEDGVSNEKATQFTEKNGIKNATSSIGSCPDFFKLSAYPHKTLINKDGICVANFRFRKVGDARGDRVGTPADFDLI